MLLPQLPSFWLDRHHCDTFVDIVAPCSERYALHSSSNPKQPSITGYCACDKDCTGLCGNVAPPADLSGSSNVHQESQHVLASLPCHRVLLSAASTFFAALLNPAWNEASSSSIKRIRVVLSDVDDVPALIALLKCIYTSEVNLMPSDLAAVTVTPSCSHTNSSSSSSLGPQHTQDSTVIPPAHSCACFNALPDTQLNMHKLCWQELSVRVLRLADQFSVPGALQAAGAKLCCLFSYQLSWRAVLALLWLPGAVMQQQMLKELRQMAIN
jgi:hypothetical protein